MKPETVLDQAALHCESRGRKLTAKRRQVLAGLVKSQRRSRPTTWPTIAATNWVRRCCLLQSIEY